MSTQTDFLPEWNQMALNGQYVGLYRFFTNQSWRYLCDPKTRKRRLFSSASEALGAARQHVRDKMNPDLKRLAPEPDEDDKDLADVLGVDQWRKSKQEQRAEAQIVRNRKSKRRVVVERKVEGGRRGGKAK